MAITSKAIAPFIAAAISVEGAYEEVEKETVEGLAEELELKDLGKEVESAFKKIEKLEDDDFDSYLEEVAKKIKASEREAVLLVTLDVLASDGVITADEMENYFAFAEVLGVEEEKASEIFDAYVEDAEDLEIEA
ncbi:hypothetical protein [Capnocytophaga gingivalis]|uniref:Co-chaperone DjlA N-terminal domain-containing protein n=1 Tax=Capnocytophaga gingivalis TaxID=1017 RepID=A0ABU5YDA3_9FLAO|nr:hypothetical protein [Capnocytophaga gingivalis]MEB3040643.1 hypothetical protein [Capnocytophaga gingivalis]